MKLIQLYSSDIRFRTVKFSPGFNVILGKITDKNNYNKDCHNLGKSTLVELIDFMLLKNLKKGSFLKKDEFKNHIFFLEILLNDGRSLTIKRSIEKNTKISFKISKCKFNNYVNETKWDYEDLPLNSRDSSTNPKDILNLFLGFNVCNDINYRNYLNYFLRNQTDYLNEFRLSKYLGGDSSWKPQLFELLGFNSKQLEKKYSLDADLTSKKKYIQILEADINLDSGKIDKLKGLIQIKENEKNDIENSLDKFNFYINEKNIDKELVENVENKISSLNTIRYNLEMDIKSLEESVEKNVSFDLEKTCQIFKEVNIYFSSQLKKSYEELIEFNNILTNDRNKYIFNTLEEKKEKLKLINNELNLLNEKRTELLSTLKESDLFKKYKSYEKQLIQIEKDLENYLFRLNNLKMVDEEKNKLSDIESEIDKTKKYIKSQIDSENSFYNLIRNSFSEYVKYILDKPGLLSIEENSAGNPEFTTEILNIDDDITSQAKGYTYKKILCACFDLAILVNYSKKSFFKFVYHDGCLENLDPRKRKNYLDLVEMLCKKYDIQYILSLIESDLPIVDGNPYKLPSDCNIAVELSDKDDSTTLFGFTF